jgi:ABC-type uncharacterized transport system substrate-binding protein
VRSEVVFAPDGKIAGVRHAWEFDEMYSAYAVQGLGKDGKPPTREELAPLAKTNVESLAEFEFFTCQPEQAPSSRSQPKMWRSGQ